MCKILIFVFLLVSIFTANTQPIKLDSVKNALSKYVKQPQTIQRDSLITITLIETTKQIPYENLAVFKTFADSLSRFAKNSLFKQAIAYSYLNYGTYYSRNGLYSLSITNSKKARDLFKSFGNEAMYKNANLLLMGRLVNSMHFNSDIMDKKERLKNLVFLNDCAKIILKNGNDHEKSVVELAYGLYYFTDKNYKQSYLHYKNSTDIVEKDSLNEFFQYYGGKWAQGMLLLYLNKKKEANTLIEIVRKECQKNRPDQQNLFLIFVMNTELSNYYLQQKDFNKAIEHGNLAINYTKDKSLLNLFQIYVNDILYKAYQQKGDFKNANLYLSKNYSYLKDDEMKKYNESLSDWQVKYETEKNQTQIKSLENEKLQTTAKRQNWIRNFLIFSLLAGVGFIYYFYQNNRKLIAKNKEIEQALLLGQTIERKRVAQELHDNLSAKISGIRWRLEAIMPKFDSDKQKKIYASSVNALAEVYTDVRLIAHNLLPDELETKGLKTALEKLIEELNSLGKTSFFNKISNDLGRFESKIEYEIYSTILEISNNILKHSKATEANIFIEKIAQKLQITIADNGIGINEATNQKGMGMANLKSRIESLKGKIEFVNNDGLTVKIEVPFK